MEQEVTLRVLLEKPTAGVDFGLQKGHESNYETVSKQRSEGKDLVFEFTVRVKVNKEDIPTFIGPFVQGPSNGKFVYIDIGTCAGQTGTAWSRRLKIPLTGISTDMIRQLLADSNYTLNTTVAGTGKGGGPNCGSVKPFSGWKLATP